MSLGNTTEVDILNAILRGEDPAWRAGASVYLALYTADPGEAGSANTNEAGYTGYARVALTKASAFSGTNPQANAALIQFGKCTAAPETVTHWALVTTASGAGQILISGALSQSLDVGVNVQPQFDAGALTFTAD